MTGSDATRYSQITPCCRCLSPSRWRRGVEDLARLPLLGAASARA